MDAKSKPAVELEAQALASRLLLGELPEDERVKLEERCLDDAAFFEALIAAENDLVDGYVRNELDEVEREMFEKRYLASPRHRRRVDAAAAIAAKADAELKQLNEPAPFPTAEIVLPFAAPRAEPPKRRTLAVPLAIAAGLFLAMSGTLAFTTWSLNRKVDALSAQRASAEAKWKEAVAQGEVEKKRLEAALAEKTAALSSVEKVKKPVSVVFSLSMDTTRGTREPEKLHVPPGADEVKLQLSLDGEDAYRIFRVVLRTKTGEEIWNQATLQPRSTSIGRAVVLPVRSGLLRPGSYELLLQGLTTEGKVEDVGYYYFNIVGK
ncbi:MAG TPA: hypothetical protein VGR00_01845 [Thermoanaerobaculia bacterium]|nr:hypothetical protein [Thermoanaerobaculia bacterium]